MAITESTFSLEDLDGTNGYRLDGAFVSGGSGISVSNAGDVNGDGFDDFIIGEGSARFDFVTQAGAAYVVFGKANGFPVSFNLEDLDGTNGFIIPGELAFDRLGDSVSGAGDVNGDGFDDIIVGATGAASKLADGGASYIIFGKAAGFDASFDLSTIDGTNGFIFFGTADDDEFGTSVSGAGDVNGDGFDDLIIGAPGAGSKLDDAGSSYVVFGKAEDFDADFLIGDLDGTDGFRIDGEAESDMSGTSVSSAGDVNGDGFDDLIIGAPEINRLQGQGTNGISYVLFGKAGGFDAAVKLDSVDGTIGFRLIGGQQSERSGWSVSSAGDINNDGFDDLILGAPYADGFTGSAYIVFGKAVGFPVDFDLSTLDGTNGFRLDGRLGGDWTGASVSNAGDFNGDGIDDLIVGAFQADTNPVNSGAAYLVFGKAGGFDAVIDLEDLNGSQGIRLEGVAEFDTAGVSVSGAGDINGDGFDDLIIGANGADNNGSFSGSSYVIFGSNAVINSNPTGSVTIDGMSIEGQTLTASDDLVDVDGIGVITYQWNIDGTPLQGATGMNFLVTQDHVGKTISVTASYTDNIGNEESVDSQPTIRAAFMDGVRFLSDLDGSNGLRIDGEGTQDRWGWSVSGSGDINGDGISDLIVGGVFDDPNGSNSGAGAVVFGKDGDFDPIIDLGDLDGTDGFTLFGVDTNDNTGNSVSLAGDVNGDGFDDLIIGAPGADPDINKTGASYVFFGRTGGFPTSIELADLDGTDGFRLNGVALDDLSGDAVSAAGDINGDGFDDLLVGARNADPNNVSNSGASYVVFGKAAGFAPSIDLDNLDGGDGFRLDGEEVNDNAGFSVSGGGDINGDGFDDLVIGAYAANKNGGNSGSTYVVFGKAEAFDATQNLVDLDGTDGFRLDGVTNGDHAGWSVSNAGDVNGDGFDDLIIGGQGVDNNADSTGSSYVVFGMADGFPAALQLEDLDGTDGFRLDGVMEDDRAGIAVSSAGDVNGDGFGDLVIGAPFADPNGEDSGASYLVYGKESGFSAVIDLAYLDGSDGVRLDGEALDDNLGQSVSGAGDVNDDGYDDIILGAPRADSNGPVSGSSYVIFGEGLPGILLQGGINEDTLEGTRGEDTLIGNEGNDHLTGSFGNDEMDGSDGLDTAMFQSLLAQTRIENDAGELTVHTPDDGKDTLLNIERLGFEDLSLAFDLEGNAGTIARLLGVALGDSWYNRSFVGIGLDLVDNSNISDDALYDLAFGVVLGNNPSDEAVVTLIYTNLVGQAPTQQVVDSFVASLLTSGAYTQGELGALAGNDALTETLINFVGISTDGLEFIPVL